MEQRRQVSCDTSKVTFSLALNFSKHHGAGNDFLVADRATSRMLAHRFGENLGEMASRLCDRRKGFGSDGLISANPGGEGEYARMLLYNADGSRAAMSGNGIRCFAQALLFAELEKDEGEGAERNGHGSRESTHEPGDPYPREFLIGTDAGPRRIVVEGPGPVSEIGVSMGEVNCEQVGLDDPRVAWLSDFGDLNASRIALADVGNPHLVIAVPSREDLDKVDLPVLGSEAQARFRGGVNVEVACLAELSGSGRPEVLMKVFERGVGPTGACGTGSTAVASAFGLWGLEPGIVLVHNPEGLLSVALGQGEPILSGTIVEIGKVSAWVETDSFELAGDGGS